jgi:alkylhydroperoxidase family enzyme
MLRSWRSEDYKRGERPALADLPVRLAYGPEPREAPNWPARATVPPADVLARAEQLGSPPQRWTQLLAVRPDLLAAWTGLYWETTQGGVLGPRISQLVRLRMSQLLDCPEWAPLDSPAIREAGLGEADVAALGRRDTSWLTPKERAALAYADAIVVDSDVPDEVFADVAAALSEPEVVQLGFAVAVQNGAIRVYRSLRACDVSLGTDGACAEYGAQPINIHY